MEIYEKIKNIILEKLKVLKMNILNNDYKL